MRKASNANHQTTARIGAIFMALAGMTAAPGCIIVPIPYAKHKPPAEGGRERVSRESVEPIEIGEWSREDMWAQVGVPDLTWENERIDMWHWSDRAGFFYLQLGLDAVAGEWTKEKMLLAQFDSDDRLTKVSFEKIDWFESFGEQLRSFRDREE